MKEKTMKSDKKTLTRLARVLNSELEKRGTSLPHAKCLEVCASLLGERNLHTLQAKLAGEPPQAENDRIKAWIEKKTKDGDMTLAVVKNISLHQFLVSVLMEEDAEFPYEPGLEELAYDIDQGSYIGDVEKLGARNLETQEVAPILEEIGNDGEFFEPPIPCLPTGEIFLTNALGEDVGHVPAEALEELGLKVSEDCEESEDGYPLTEEEQKHLAEEIEICGETWLGNYTTLWKREKFHCPTLEIPHKDAHWDKETNATLPTEEQAMAHATATQIKIAGFLRKKKGDSVIENDMPGRVCVRMRIPLSPARRRETLALEEILKRDPVYIQTGGSGAPGIRPEIRN